MKKREAKAADKVAKKTSPVKPAEIKKTTVAKKTTVSQNKPEEKKKPSQTTSTPKLQKVEERKASPGKKQAAVPPVSKVLPKGSGQVHPKKPKTNYMFFSAKMMPKLQEQQPEAALPQLSKQVGEAWKKASAEQKKPFDNMQVLDKERYAKQMKMLEKKGFFVFENGMKSSEVRDPLKEDLRPKRPANAAIFFVGPQIKKLHGEEGLKITDCMKKAYEIWATLDEEAKQPYVAQTVAGRERYDRQRQEFDKFGYFTMEDGSKSFQHKAKVKRTKANNSDPEKLSGKRSKDSVTKKEKVPVKKAPKPAPASQKVDTSLKTQNVVNPAKVARRTGSPNKKTKTQ